MKRAVIFGSAPVSDWSFLQDYLFGNELIICADGGRITAEALGFIPDWYVGDSDSGGYSGNCPADLLPSEKDLTDLEMGVSRALKEGCGFILLCGCTGGREDHHFSAIGLLERIHCYGAQGMIVDPDNEITLLTPGETIVPVVPQFRYFGIVPLDNHLTGVTITNAKYCVADTDFYRTSSLGISNEVMNNQCTIRYQDGIGLLVRSVRMIK